MSSTRSRSVFVAGSGSLRMVIAGLFVVVVTAGWAWAHFQLLIPSRDIIGEKDAKTINLDIIFTHPMVGGPVMEMGKPTKFGVLVNGRKKDLLSLLKLRKIENKSTYTAAYKIREPGDYIFYVAPAAYWEPAEEKMIIHYTKVVVDAFDAEEGWDDLVGLPVEIKPLVRPYGLWAGNLFRGVVLHNGKPVPYAEVEVEFYNKDGKIKPQSDAFVTQVIKADRNGVFSYSMPRAGWWAFAALVDGGKMKNPRGKMVDVELGGLIWVKTVKME